MDDILSLLKGMAETLERISRTGSPWLTINEAAAYVHMKPQRLREAVYRGDLPSYSRGKKSTFVHRDEVDAWMRSMPSAARVPEVLRRAS